eukprot:213105-Amphidinium_carterae.1
MEGGEMLGAVLTLDALKVRASLSLPDDEFESLWLTCQSNCQKECLEAEALMSRTHAVQAGVKGKDH